jgi:flavodoxin
MSKSLVAYFSATGTTAKVAAKLAGIVSADLYEIKPAQPYTQADLNWGNKSSRSSVEMSDKSSRPAIVGSVKNLEHYDTVFVGFPIWWYVAPTIINTFLEAHNLEGKKVALFATSGGSGMGNTVSGLKNSCTGTIVEAKRFSANATEKELQNWAEKILK